ncbi:MAG: FixH family protein [Steroidobacteraceae bacterium]
MADDTRNRDSLRAGGAPILMMIGIPAVTIVGAFVTLWLALTRGESELPAQYHWEGAALQRDLDAMRLAQQRHASVRLRFEAAHSECVVQLAIDPPLPPTLQLTLAHSTRNDADQRLTVNRQGSDYRSPCTAPMPGRYLVSVAADDLSWLLRGEGSNWSSGIELAAKAMPAEH